MERHHSSANYRSFYAPFWPFLPQAFMISHLSFLVSGTPTFLLSKSHSKIHFCNIAYRKSRQLKHSFTVSTSISFHCIHCIAQHSSHFTFLTTPQFHPQCIKNTKSSLLDKKRFGEKQCLLVLRASCTSQHSQKGKYVQHHKYSVVPVYVCGTYTSVMEINRKEQPI